MKLPIQAIVLLLLGPVVLTAFLVYGSVHHATSAVPATATPQGMLNQASPLPHPASLVVTPGTSTPLAKRPKIEFKGLIGTKEQTAALLAIDGAAPKPFRPGEQITSNMVLDRIGVTGLEVSYLAPHELIPIDSPSSEPQRVLTSKNDSPSAAARLNETAKPARHVDVRFPGGVPSEGIETIQEGQFIVDRQLIEKQLSKGYIYKHAQFKKAHDGGYTVNEIARGSLFEKSGLQDGDTIQKINDIEINSITDLLTSYQQFHEQSYLGLTLQRNNEVLTYYYFLK